MKDGTGNFLHSFQRLVLFLTISRLVEFSGYELINQVERFNATQD